jgi:hypothetical protein
MRSCAPRQRLGLTADVAACPVQLRGPLEQRQLTGVLVGLLRVLGPLLQEPAVDDTAPGQGQIGLHVI